MRKLSLVLPFLLFFHFLLVGQTKVENPNHTIQSGNSITITLEQAQYRIEICTPEMIRVRLAAASGFEANEPLMVNHYQWEATPYTFTETPELITIQTTALTVKIKTHPVSIAFYTLDDILINQDIVTEKAMKYDNEAPSCSKVLQSGEHFFGFGERMDFMDQRGKKLTLDVGRGIGSDHKTGAYNILEANYSPVPFFISTKGYGIFLHNANPSTWDMGSSSPANYSFSASGGELDYYFIYGPTFKHILQIYTSLTGTSPLLPRAAMGLHVGTYAGGTWGYENLTSQYYVIALAKRFRELGIPVDILHIDSTWRIFGKVNGKGGTSFEWRQPGFPNPKAMFDSLYALNFQMVGLHIRPRIDNGNMNNYLDIAKEKGYTYPENGKPGDFPNFFDKTAIDWWWSNCLKPLADMGCKFVKTDEGSAFGRVGNELTNKTGPQGKEIASLHNLFPVAYAKAPFLKFQENNHMRGMEHTREGFAGIQRYPFIFAGDWPSAWQYFKPVMRAGLNIGMSGVPAWGHCMGGFERVSDPELYIRWCQFGMFSPIAHLFGMEHPNYKEPWSYGAEAQTIFTKYDKLRYRLIPYLYGAYYNAYLTGTPVIQALVFNYPDDVNTYTIDDQYLFGDKMLICPVTEKEAQTRTLYLPEGTWIDYWSGEKYTGKQTIITTTPLEKLPIYVKAGAIIPMQPNMQYFNQKPMDPVTLDIYPTDSASTKLYEDDGLSLNYQEGEYAQTEITCSENRQHVNIEILPTKGKYTIADRNYILWIHLDAKPTSVALQDVLLTNWTFNADKKLLELQVFKKSKEKINVRIVKEPKSKTLSIIETGSVKTMPDEWIDKNTGHRVIHLVQDGGENHSFYFHNNPFIKGQNEIDDKMIFYKKVKNNMQLFALNMKTLQSDQITDKKGISGEITAPKGNEVFFQCGDSVFACGIENHKTRLIYVFPDSIHGKITTINANETFLAGAISSKAEDQILKDYPEKHDFFERIFEAKYPRTLFTINIEKKTLQKIYTEKAWLNHVQFSPKEPNILMFCHEGPWHKVDRIWTIDINGGLPKLMHKRSMENEIAGHEFFSPDGKNIWFDLQIPRGKSFLLSGVNVKTGKEKTYTVARNEWSIHYTISPDQKIFAGDGGDSGQVAKADDGMWIYLFRPEGNHFKSEKLVTMKYHHYKLEPNVHFSPDGRWIIFRANFEGHPDIYAVEINKMQPSK